MSKDAYTKMCRAIAEFMATSNLQDNEQIKFSVLVLKQGELYKVSPYSPIRDITTSIPMYTVIDNEIKEAQE